MALEQITATTWRKLLANGEAAEIGNRDSSTFKPHLRLSGIARAYLDLELPLAGPLSPVRFTGDTIEVENDAVIARWYEANILEAGFEFEAIIKRKPASNQFKFNVSSNNIAAFYQPPRTRAEIDRGVTRSPDMDGGYVFWHRFIGNTHRAGLAEKFRAGKIGQLPRFKLTDAIGSVTYTQLNIAAGVLTATIDPTWYNSAKLPWVLDPTFGFTGIGGTGDWFGAANEWWGSVFTAPGDVATGVSISWYGRRAGATNFKGVLVDHATLNIVANGIGAATAMAVGDAWQTSAFGALPNLVPASDYIPGLVMDTGDLFLYYDAGAANQAHRDSTNSYAAPVNPNDAVHWGTNKFSSYLTYNAAAGGTGGAFNAGRFMIAMR